VEAGQTFENFHREQKLIEHREWALIERVALLVRHDLLQPLSTMAYEIDNLQSAIAKGDVSSASAIASSLADRRQDAAQLADALVDFCNREEKSVNLAEVIQTAAKLIERTARTQGIELALPPDGSSASLPTFAGSPGALVRGLFNILENSVRAIRDQKASEQSGSFKGRIDISCEGMPDGIVVTVTDNGVGMSPDIVREINAGGHPVSTQADAFHGLGLEVVRSAVLRNHGSLFVASDEGLETKVTLCFSV
jgi:signal transduction histidine kinase